jgi:hypothetical protein
MDIAFLIAEPNMSRSAMNQQYLVLDQVPVFRQGRTGSNVFGTRHEMLRAVVFGADLEHELRGSRGALVHVDAACPQFSFIPFQ